MKDRKRALATLLLAAGLLLPGAAFGAPPTPPPPADPDAASYGCSDFDNGTVYDTSTLGNVENHCGNTRKIWDPVTPTLWDGRYLNWYFSDEADAHYNEIQNAESNIEGCTQAGGAKDYAEKYRRTRLEASKQVLLDLLCVAESKNVRFALASYRETEDVNDEDPNGGYLKEDLGRANPNHAAELEAKIKSTDVNDPDVEATPLSESLFQIYTYWMSRDTADVPTGRDGTTKFPIYHYDKFGNLETNSSKYLEDTLLYECEKAFIVIVTDGLPTRDDFDEEDTTDEAEGFSDFDVLIGDYHDEGGDGVADDEEPGGGDEPSYYLDDIAKYMYDNDFRPDLANDQTVDTYTIGLATDPTTDDFLEMTAEVGHGLFFHVKDGEQLAYALIATLNDIIEKSQSFTAATVPSARTIDGGDFYQSYFFPSGRSAFWEGHIRAWHITASGDIHDKFNACALDDPDAGECNSGPFKPGAQYFWDANEQVPAPGSRSLYTSKLVTGTPTRVAFDDALAAADLSVDAFVNPPPDPSPNSALYPVMGSTALNAEGLADEIVAFTRGCFFGTGVTSADVDTPAACAARPSRLGDIFHSDPLVVRQPNRAGGNTSYRDFKSAYAGRKRVIYAGTNGGFLEAVNAGAWQAAATPPRYNAGTGTELFGFMPWETRLKIKNFPIDAPTDRNHYVDGSPQYADVWIHSSATDASQEASEWRTLLVGGLREGGHQYYALDITNPDGIAGPAGVLPYPGYMWEFPREDDPDSDMALMGETWAQPIITRVRVQVNGDDNGGEGYERWVAIVTAGYADTGDPNPTAVSGVVSSYDVNATAGRAIFILDLKTGEVLGQKKFDLAASDAQNTMYFAIPTSPAVLDLDFDGFADVIYVGDLGGQVFKWVISDIGEDRVNDGSGLRTQPNWAFKRFFRAPVTNIGGTPYFKNFFFPPAASYVSSTLWLAFASGERRHLPFTGVGSEDENNRFYVVSDLDPYERAATPLAALLEADLVDISG
ncbi:MAG: pilus assembly protein, partial [Planctomycetota bacterium]